jgi:hypothetical protein
MKGIRKVTGTTVRRMLWFARGISIALGLAAMLFVATALTMGISETAQAKTLSLKLGVSNTVKALTSMVGSVTGPILRLENDGTETGSTALDLQVKPGKAPMTVNSDSKVTNLNADELDGKDSTAFGIATNHSYQYTKDCILPGYTVEKCAPVQVTVPAGKKYTVSVWSTMDIRTARTSGSGYISYCSGADYQGGCITPYGVTMTATLPANQYVPASSEGESVTLEPGTYTFATYIYPDEYFLTGDGVVITKLLVKDASNPGPTEITTP